jgi:hypothetical protein
VDRVIAGQAIGDVCGICCGDCAPVELRTVGCVCFLRGAMPRGVATCALVGVEYRTRNLSPTSVV